MPWSTGSIPLCHINIVVPNLIPPLFEQEICIALRIHIAFPRPRVSMHAPSLFFHLVHVANAQDAQPDDTARLDTQAASNPTTDPATPADDSQLTLFPHSNTSRYWVSGQANLILQWHPGFPTKYSGPNSLRAAGRTPPPRSTRFT